MHRKVLIVLSAIIIGFTTAKGEAFEAKSNFDNYQTIVSGLSSFDDKLRLFQAVWTELLQKFSTDQLKTRVLFKELSLAIKQNKDTCECDIRHAIELQQEIAQSLITQSSDYVAKILNSQQYPTETELKYFLDLSLLEPALKNSIFESAIDKIYNFKEPQVLAAHFNYLREKISVAPLEDMTRAQLYLYRKFLARGQVNKVYLVNVGYYFLQIKSSSEYEEFPSHLKRALDNVINSLPSSLKYFYFEPKFCLLNKRYPEFIYTTENIPIDETNVHIFTWVEKSPVDEHGEWVKFITTLDENLPQANLRFQLMSKKFGRYMHRATIANLNNIIVSRKDGTLPPNRDFTVEYHNNTLAFRQNGFIMCASNALRDNDRRYVFTHRDEKHTTLTPACQWIARECY